MFPEIDRVILLRQGRVAFDGPKSAGLTPRELSPVFGASIGVESDGGYFRVRL